MFRTLTEIIESGYCMGCGLCGHYASDAIEMLVADSGQMLPTIARDLTAEENAEIVRLCPGVSLDAPLREGDDPVWGTALRVCEGWPAPMRQAGRRRTSAISQRPRTPSNRPPWPIPSAARSTARGTCPQTG